MALKEVNFVFSIFCEGKYALKEKRCVKYVALNNVDQLCHKVGKFKCIL